MTKKQSLSAMIVPALLVAVVILAAACGGSPSATSTATAPSTVTTAVTTGTNDDATATSADDTATSGSSEVVTGSGSVAVSGLVDHPMTLSPVNMNHMNWITVTVDDPTAGSMAYDGVKLSEVFALFGVQSAAKTVLVTAADGSSAEIALADVGADAVLAVNDDDVFNMVMPGRDASDWVKNVVSMQFR